jgi:hypothetical protein
MKNDLLWSIFFGLKSKNPLLYIFLPSKDIVQLLVASFGLPKAKN